MKYLLFPVSRVYDAIGWFYHLLTSRHISIEVQEPFFSCRCDARQVPNIMEC